MELGSLQLYSPRMRGFGQTKSRPAAKATPKAAWRCAGGEIAQPKMCVRGGGGCQRGVFLSSGKLQTDHYTEQQGRSKYRPRARRPLRGPLILSTAAPAETCEFGNGRQARIYVEETCLTALQFFLSFCLSLARGKLLPFKCVDRRRQRVFPVP